MEFILRKNIYVFVRGRPLEACWFQPHVFPACGCSPRPAWGSCRNNCTGSLFLQCEVVGSFRAEIRSPLRRPSKEWTRARLLPSSSRPLQGRLRLHGFSVFPGYVAQLVFFYVVPHAPQELFSLLIPFLTSLPQIPYLTLV